MKKMTLEQFKEQFNIKLNNQQLKAVQSVQNPTLLLAVPGSGKTTVLVTRLGYMIYWRQDLSLEQLTEFVQK